MSIKVLHPGLLTTIQDLGRYGYQKHGVIVSGAMDCYSMKVANFLVGNEAGAACLEITLLGPRLLIEEDLLIAVTGGDLSPTVAGKAISMWRPVYIKRGSVLEFGACKTGCRAYLAVAGGYQLPEVMASRSTYLRAGIGGFSGRALKKNDLLPVNPPPVLDLIKQLRVQGQAGAFAAPAWYAGAKHISKSTMPVTVRITRGIQFDYFTAESITQLTSQVFQVTTQSDRMGYRLSGVALKLSEPLEMVSEAIALGTVQVPPDGNPIILLADRQTVGGYPKIAQVALVDVAAVAQIRPGGKIQFKEISGQQAEELYCEREEALQFLKTAIALKLSGN